jgi:ADP-ribose pyrophosphatase YjhB (NUDIX family)
MEPEHFVGKVAHKAAIEKDGKVLLVKSLSDEFWDIPGGRIHCGEKPAQALKREMKEELGIDVIVGSPFFADLIISTKTKEERYFICFNASLADPNAELKLDQEDAEQLLWISEGEVDTVPMYEVCRDALRAYFAQK